MNHYIYKITDLTNGFEYIGVRSCKRNVEEDSYYGSGVLISEEIREHGKRFFHKEIVATLRSREEALRLESMIVNKDYISRPDTYNITTGGQTSRFSRKQGVDSPWHGKKHKVSSRNKMSKAKIGKTGRLSPNYKGTYYCGEFGCFDSCGLASSAIGLTVSTISNRCKSIKFQWIDWFFVPSDQEAKTYGERLRECDYYYIINGDRYHSIKKASESLGIPERTLAGYVQAKKPGFKKVINE